jgi:methyl-accepting chemotaxis protein
MAGDLDNRKDDDVFAAEGVEFEKKILTELLNQSQQTMEQSLQEYQSTVMAAISQFGQSIESMTSGIKQISASSQELRDSVERQKESIQELSESQRQIDEISKDGVGRVRDLSSRIGELNDLSTSLQSMLDETSDIADQLHILSINGSIEAARAGSVYGAPFKVVAQEISTLSHNASSIIEKQTDSVKHILSIISNVNTISDESVESFRTNSETISDNVRLFDSLNEEMQSIASSAEELAAVIEEFTGTIEEMKSGVQDLQNSAVDFQDRLRREFAVNAFAARLTTNLREKTSGTRSLQEAAQAVTEYIYERFSTEENLPDPALVRVFITRSYSGLSREDLREMADLPKDYPRYLCLAGTTGLEPNWNDRRKSKNHRVIPLPETAEELETIPMLAEMFKRMDVDYSRVVHPEGYKNAQSMIEGYMLVEQAAGSPYIPAQEEFVKSYGISSELGYGGFLPSGTAYTCFLFSKEPLSTLDAEKLKVLSPALQQAFLPFDTAGAFWNNSAPREQGETSGYSNSHF